MGWAWTGLVGKFAAGVLRHRQGYVSEKAFTLGARIVAVAEEPKGLQRGRTGSADVGIDLL